MEISVKKENIKVEKMSQLSEDEKVLSVAFMLDKIVEEKIALLTGKLNNPKGVLVYTSLSKNTVNYNSLCDFGLENGKKTLNVLFQYKSFNYLYNELLPIMLFAITYSYYNNDTRSKKIKEIFEKILDTYSKTNTIDKDGVKLLSKEIYAFLDDIDINFVYDILAQKTIIHTYNIGILNEVNNSYFKMPMLED